MTKPYLLPKATAFLLLILCLCNNLFAQTTLQNAWQAFFENKTESARSLFTKASAEQATAGDALLGLSLLAQMDRPATESFDYFKKFYLQSKDPQPYIYALWMTSSINETSGKKSDDQLAFFRELTQKKDYDGTVAAIAYSMIGNSFNSAKQSDAAAKEFAHIGSIDNWAISGEFENISTSGFDKEYPTLLHPEDKSSFINKNGVSVAWHPVPYLRHDKWFDFTYYSNAYDAILFAQSFINSPTDQEVQLRIGVSGSVKVWVNDKLMLSEPEERNNDLDSYIQSVKLNKGYNRVVVQIGESYAERSNFLVRFTDKNGQLLPGITSSASYHPYMKESSYESKKSEQFAVAYFEQQIKQHPDDYLPQLLLVQTCLQLDRTYEARKVLQPLVSKFPNSTYLNIQLLTLFNKTKNKTGAQTIRETIKMADPESLIGLSLKYNEFYEQKAYDKAADVNAKIEKAYPFNLENVYSNKIDLADANKNQEELVKLIDEAYQKYPDNKTFMGDKVYVEQNIRKDLQKSIEVQQKFVNTNDNYSAAKDLADMYFNSGKPADAIKVFHSEIANDSIGIKIYSDLAEQYYKQQQYDKAAQNYLSCIKISPTTGDYYTSLGQVYAAMPNQKLKAIQAYQKGLQLNPSDYESIKALRKLQNKKDVFSYFEEPDVAAMIKNAPKANDYPNDNFIILDKEVQKVAYENGGSEDQNYVVVKIFNQKGIDALKEYSIGYNNDQNLLIETAEVIKPNGTKVPADRNENNLVFTNLEIGDVINVSYKLSNYFKGSLASHFWDSFYFSMGFPSVKLKYSLLVSKNKKFSYKFSGQNIEPVKKDADEFTLYSWKSDNNKGIVVEDKMPSSADVSNTFYLTSIPDWKYISDWYNDIATAKARPNYEVKAVVGELFEGSKGLNDQQKVEKIYNYITGNISYSSVSFRQSGIIPQNPADVINTRIGDCKDVATLFVTMCKEAGIKAQLVLVKTRNFGLNSMVLPTIDFNHCMAKVNLNNKDYYFELTSKYLPVSFMYTQYVNSSILEIGGADPIKAIKYLNPATRKENDINISTDIAFRDKDLLINEKSNRTAAQTAMFRTAFKDLSASDRTKKFKEFISSQFPDNDISELTFNNLDNTSDTVYVHLKYEIRNVAKEVAGLNIFSLPWEDKLSPRYLNITSPRYSGVDISQMFAMDSESETITLNMPENKKLVEDPSPIILKSDFMDYSIIPQTKNGKLIITRSLKLKKDFIPADKALEFNTFFKKIIEADNKEFAMK
ncbi:MAG TPA: DUF3857 domain-containing protein [Mucilaginibacter sp.]|nr:DUF3857 domain-containing protein [Mucilaginibacter sp.]